MIKHHCDRCDVVLATDEVSKNALELCRFCRRSFNRWMHSYEKDCEKNFPGKYPGSGTIVDPELTSLNPEDV